VTYAAKVLADSVTGGVRLATIEVQFPRFILAEFNTHRVFCLAGDTQLEFDLPAGSRDSECRVHHMRLDDFVDKWLHGARRYAANPKREYDLSWIEPNGVYAAPYAAARMGMASAANIHTLCRRGEIEAHQQGRTWMITGEALKRWRQSTPEHTRFDMRTKLAGMHIRQLNEHTGDIQRSHVTDATTSGTKDVYEVIAGDFTIAGSLDHRVLTTEGWERIGDISRGDLLIVRKFGKRGEDRLDPLRLKKIGGVWRSAWQRDERARLVAESPLCRRCSAREGVEIHHVEPVYQNPARAFDQSNIVLLCDACHNAMHETQGWQGGTYLYGAAVPVEEVRFRGVEPTYDLTIAGEFPNFLANGVVVHNSRNSASSRAIPVETRIKQVIEHPFVPEAFGKNKGGMQAGESLEGDENERARRAWLLGRNLAVDAAQQLMSLGVHKQHANRLLEPFVWHTVVVSSTEWANFFALRCHPAAQPEMQITASLMRDALDASTPRELSEGEWHLPYVHDDERAAVDFAQPYEVSSLVALSVVRCAAVSYDRQLADRTWEQVARRYSAMRDSGHWSPFEHAAKVASAEEVRRHALHRYVDDVGFEPAFIGNFAAPWLQHRKMLPGEALFHGGR